MLAVSSLGAAHPTAAAATAAAYTARPTLTRSGRSTPRAKPILLDGAKAILYEGKAPAARPRLTLCALFTVYVTNQVRAPLCYIVHAPGLRAALILSSGCVGSPRCTRVQWSRGLLANTVSFRPESLAEGSRYVNAALGFSPQTYANLLAAFSCAYACMSIPAGLVADVRKRVPTLSIACGCWSMAMCLHASAASVPTLMLSRILHGMAAAFCSPVANSLIADAFSEGQRGAAYSVYASGLYIGFALAILSASAPSLSLAAAPALHLGWRSGAWTVASASALAALALALGVREPRRQGVQSVAHAAAPRPGVMAESVRSVCSVVSCPSALLSLLAVATRTCAGYTIASWLPPHCKARFPGEERAFALLYASAVCAGGMLAALVGGFLSDAISRRSRLPNARAAVPLVGSLLAAPLFLVALTRGSLGGTMAWFCAHILCAEVWLGPTVATMLGSLPADARGTAQGLSNFVQIGAGLLQAAVAPAASHFGLGRALLVTVPVAYIASACAFAAVLRCSPRPPSVSAK